MHLMVLFPINCACLCVVCVYTWYSHNRISQPYANGEGAQIQLRLRSSSGLVACLGDYDTVIDNV